MGLHIKCKHASRFTILNKFRKDYWMPTGFGVIRKILRKCQECKRHHNRTIKLNESSYRDFRAMPPETPFQTVFIDHAGHFNVRIRGEKCKVYILIFTCLWSRAIDLVICYDLSLQEVLRAMQLHNYRYGLFEYCLSDLGSSLVASSKVISEHFEEPEMINFLTKNDTKHITFDQYYKGNHELGGLVESCVKITKQLIYKTIKKNVLNLPDFELLVTEINYLANQRPVAFQDALIQTNSNEEDMPTPITPQHLISGRDINAINIIPNIDVENEEILQDKNWSLQENQNQFQRTQEKLNLHHKTCRTLRYMQTI